jgi:N-acetylneuraminic acid mutarotase
MAQHEHAAEGSAMRRAGARTVGLCLACALGFAPSVAAAAPDLLPDAAWAAGGRWRVLAPAPIAPEAGAASVWTGRQVLVVGRTAHRSEDGAERASVEVAASYDPRTNRWRRLTPPQHGRAGVGGRYSVAWTGAEAVVWGPGTYAAFDPATNRWRRLPPPPPDAHGQGGIVAWTGRELVGWGGGCCGDAFADGVAFDPAANVWRRLAASPLAGSQAPIGAWTGRELVIFVSGIDPDGRPSPSQLARAAAYDPGTDTWRRITPLPAPRGGAIAVWDGHEVLVVGGAPRAPNGGLTPLARRGFAYDPSTDSWRRLPPMESGRFGAAAVWTGGRLLVWGGTSQAGSYTIPTHGLAYDPAANRWSALPTAPVLGRLDPTATWTGRDLIVWGGTDPYRPFADGAALRP